MKILPRLVLGLSGDQIVNGIDSYLVLSIVLSQLVILRIVYDQIDLDLAVLGQTEALPGKSLNPLELDNGLSGVSLGLGDGDGFGALGGFHLKSFCLSLI